MSRCCALLAFMLLALPAPAQHQTENHIKTTPRKLPKPAVIKTPGPEVPVVSALAPGDAAPELAGRMLDGEPAVVRWDGHQVTVVNFWATWCVPCKTEMPALQELYAKREKDGLAIWGVEVDQGDGEWKVEEARRFVADLKVLFPVIHENAGTSAKWGGIGTLPTTFLVGRNGKIIRKYVGATPSQTEGLVTDVNAVLDGRPLGTQVLPPSAEAKPEGS